MRAAIQQRNSPALWVARLTPRPFCASFSKDRRRWWIVWTLLFSTAINYVNRQTLSVLAPVISNQFHLTHTQLSNIFGAFQFAYAGAWLVGGIFLDVAGTRLGLSIAVVWWSVVSVLTSFVNSAFSLGVLRFLLGIGEGFNWPGASKAVAEFFPAQERSVAVAIFDSGSSIGGAVAAVSIPWIAIKFGWRSALRSQVHSVFCGWSSGYSFIHGREPVRARRATQLLHSAIGEAGFRCSNGVRPGQL